jgi:hypothetical protein
MRDYFGLTFSDLTVFPTPWMKIKPLQIKEEITELLKIPAKLRLKYILEIGTARCCRTPTNTRSELVPDNKAEHSPF